VSLVITVDDPAVTDGTSDRHFYGPAGSEAWRHTVWGTNAIAKWSPLLAEIKSNLFVPREQFSKFESQCRLVDQHANEITSELGWGEGGGNYLRERISIFLQAVAFARAHGSDMIRIW
jgi:hypothetical protein